MRKYGNGRGWGCGYEKLRKYLIEKWDVDGGVAVVRYGNTTNTDMGRGMGVWEWGTTQIHKQKRKKETGLGGCVGMGEIRKHGDMKIGGGWGCGYGK